MFTFRTSFLYNTLRNDRSVLNINLYGSLEDSHERSGKNESRNDLQSRR